MGVFLSLLGLAGLMVGLISFFQNPRELVALHRKSHAAGLVAVSGVILAVVLMDAILPPPTPATASVPAPDRLSTVSAYVRSNAAGEAASVSQYTAGEDGSNVIAATRLPNNPASLDAAQKICDLARRVVEKVTVKAADGSILWTCDRVNSRGSQLLLAQERTTTTTSIVFDPTTTRSSNLATGAAVTRAAPSAVAPESDSACHPSYEGECLPADASDVDCVFGNGNGPVYAMTRDIRVVGPDDFGLDADGDNLGCDSPESSFGGGSGGNSNGPRPTVTRPTRPKGSTTTTTTVPAVTTTTTEPEPTSSCHPSYQGDCLPLNASGVDCVGGTGDGPIYTQNRNIQVVGPDDYGLDRDNDGVACEG